MWACLVTLACKDWEGSVPTFNFTTGPSTLPGIGTLSYNGCKFSALFETRLSGDVVKDAAVRTTKFMGYDLQADGYVTLPDGAVDISANMANLRTLLTAQGGALVYTGRGFDLSVNNGAGSVADAAWGPVPKLIEFQPLGGGLSAKVVWSVKVHLPEIPRGVRAGASMLQFNCETSVTYGEDWYSGISVRGTMEIPLTRRTQATRTLTTTVDDLRGQLDRRIFNGIDLSRFRVAHRNYNISRDKRTLEFDVAVEEKPYMDIPPACTMARGTYSVRPSKSGAGLCNWMCTLRATYTVRNDRSKRLAWYPFLALMRLRMNQSTTGVIPNPGGNQNPGAAALQVLANINAVNAAIGPGALWRNIFGLQQQGQQSRKAWLIDLSFDEGLYADSKTMSFSATWRLVTTFDAILLASGLWRKVPELDAQGRSLWATTVADAAGSQSWLANRLDPALDLIVDFGGQ